MFDVFRSRLDIRGTLITVTALRIGAGRSVEPIGSDLPVVKDAVGNPFIPGASFKGAMRSRLESFLRAIDDRFAVDPDRLILRMNQRVKDLKREAEKIEERSRDSWLTDALLSEKDLVTDYISHLFGAPWLAGKLQIRDLYVVPGSWFGQYQERDGVAIDRDTETASDGKLYDFQVVPAGTQFEFRAVVENAEDWELGLLAIGLHQFETEQIPLGGGRSRGLGVVKLDIESMKWFDLRAANDSNPDPQKVLDYLKQLVSGEEPEFQDGMALREAWGRSLIAKLEGSIAAAV